jgi:hypothetical protein
MWACGAPSGKKENVWAMDISVREMAGLRPSQISHPPFGNYLHTTIDREYKDQGADFWEW